MEVDGKKTAVLTSTPNELAHRQIKAPALAIRVNHHQN
jgi:hypothetical protein